MTDMDSMLLSLEAVVEVMEVNLLDSVVVASRLIMRMISSITSSPTLALVRMTIPSSLNSSILDTKVHRIKVRGKVRKEVDLLVDSQDSEEWEDSEDSAVSVMMTSADLDRYSATWVVVVACNKCHLAVLLVVDSVEALGNLFRPRL